MHVGGQLRNKETVVVDRRKDILKGPYWINIYEEYDKPRPLNRRVRNYTREAAVAVSRYALFTKPNAVLSYRIKVTLK